MGQLDSDSANGRLEKANTTTTTTIQNFVVMPSTTTTKVTNGTCAVRTRRRGRSLIWARSARHDVISHRRRIGKGLGSSVLGRRRTTYPRGMGSGYNRVRLLC
uniref:(northern house mosquito) hypothetical protein n=1 Tax=Culex pipiens TaxID=7175 RepID=A0A8D8FZ13_CULPI